MNKQTMNLMWSSLFTMIVLSNSASAASNDGKIINDGDVVKVDAQHNNEFNTPLEGLNGPSAVWLHDQKVMRAAAANLPTTRATRQETLSDADRGALFESGRHELLEPSRTQLD